MNTQEMIHSSHEWQKRHIEEKEEKPLNEAELNFLTTEEIELLVEKNEKMIRGKGLTVIGRIGEPIIDAEGRIFALGFECQKIRQEEEVTVFVTIDIRDSKLCYLFNGDLQQPLVEFDLPTDFQSEQLLDASRAYKVVKSRPMFMYPQLFDLPAKDVWPKDASVAVIGDPYQLCDRKDTTIVEYEYIDEIFPPILSDAVKNEGLPEGLTNETWYETLFHEDLGALERMYGDLFTPSVGNPYIFTVQEGINLMSRISESLWFDNNTSPKQLADWKKELTQLQNKLAKLSDGSWAVDDFPELKEESQQEDYMTFFSFKQDAIEAMGNPERWTDFVGRWEQYLDQLPLSRLRSEITNFDEKIEQARHWLSVLPKSKSQQRVNNGLNWLEKLYEEISSHPEKNGDYYDAVYSSKISDALSNGLMSDGAFGFIIPGRPISSRNRRFLDTISRQAYNMLDYAEHLWPQLSVEAERLRSQNIKLSDETLFAYLRSMEQSLIKERYFKNLAQKAVSLHGFFPYRVSLDPQDRILALTSVTMHGWNYLKRDEFRRDIETSLPFLKIGGKYILGPINQRVYFGGQDEGFDALGLTEALEELQQAGKIEYRFIKGKREYDNEFSEADEETIFSPDETKLLPGESAASLVITRLA